jgi:hypothetical protein
MKMTDLWMLYEADKRILGRRKIFYLSDFKFFSE